MSGTQFLKWERKFRKLIWSKTISKPLNIGPVIWICSGFMTNEDGLQSTSRKHRDDKFRVVASAGRTLSSRYSSSLQKPSEYLRASLSVLFKRAEFYQHRFPPVKYSILLQSREWFHGEILLLMCYGQRCLNFLP